MKQENLKHGLVLRSFLSKSLILLFCISAQSLCAGEPSRMTDFMLNVDLETCGHSHTGSVNTQEPSWSYFVAPNYFQHYSKKEGLDYGKMLSKDTLLHLNCSNMLFTLEERNAPKRHQLFAKYQLSSENAYLYWKSYGNDNGKLSSGAIVMKYAVSRNGAYSLQCPLAVLSHHQQTVNGAIHTIGTYSKSMSTFQRAQSRSTQKEFEVSSSLKFAA